MPEFLEHIRKGRKEAYKPKEKYAAHQIRKMDVAIFQLQADLYFFATTVEREACIQEGVPLANDPRQQGILTALLGRVPSGT